VRAYDATGNLTAVAPHPPLNLKASASHFREARGYTGQLTSRNTSAIDMQKSTKAVKCRLEASKNSAEHTH